MISLLGMIADVFRFEKELDAKAQALKGEQEQFSWSDLSNAQKIGIIFYGLWLFLTIILLVNHFGYGMLSIGFFILSLVVWLCRRKEGKSLLKEAISLIGWMIVRISSIILFPISVFLSIRQLFMKKTHQEKDLPDA